MAAKKFYAVKKGKIPGIYFSWEDCKRVVDGYPGPVYRGFATLEEAEAFIGNSAAAMTKKEAAEGLPENYAFVDGSYKSLWLWRLFISCRGKRNPSGFRFGGRNGFHAQCGR